MSVPYKILQLKDCYFRLPDNFNGTKEEAMTLFVEYFCRTKENAIKHEGEVDNWENFKSLWPHDKFKYSGATNAISLVNKEWEVIAK